MSVILRQKLDLEEKLALMKEDAKFEVGSDLDAESTVLACALEIKSRPRPAKVPKMFLASGCIFNCSYCGCRCSREAVSYTHLDVYKRQVLPNNNRYL